MSDDIAVIGMACRLPGADSVDAYWANLVGEVEAITRGDCDGPSRPVDSGAYVRAVGRVDGTDLFDADYFRVPPAEAIAMDPQQRVLLEVAAAALASAGYAGAHDAVVGVYAGCGENFYYKEHVAPNRGFVQSTGEMRVLMGNEKDFLAPRVAFKLGLTGPSLTIQATCATSLAAVALACQALVAGDCDIALAGGVSLLLPDVDGYTYGEGGILSADGRCRAFDANASGTLPASGVGVVVLKREDAARADRDHRHAVIRGWAVNNDGGSRAGFTVPNVAGQASAIRTALTRAGAGPEDVTYVETHGTGTPIGDPVEIEALRAAFTGGGRPPASCAVGSVKPSIGHADAAAGVAGLIKAVLAVEHGLLPASLNFEAANPEIDLDGTPFHVNRSTTAWAPESGARIAGVSAFGLGGNNVHVVLGQAPPIAPAPAERRRQVLALSARTAEDLEQMRQDLADWLAAHEPLSDDALADVAYTLAVGRPRFACRWAAVVGTSAEAEAALRAVPSPQRSTTRWSLVVSGGSDELACLARADAFRADPLIGEQQDALVADAGVAPGALPDHEVAALGVLAAVRALEALGPSFARIDVPRWMAPAGRWLDQGRHADDLRSALARCAAGEQPGGRGAGAGRVIVDAAFDLPTAVAEIWSLGGVVRWDAYHDPAARSRVPLPTYPFARRRYWLDRVERPVAYRLPTPVVDEGGSTLEFIEAVWREVLGKDAIDLDAHFVDDLDGDSMYAVEIGAQLHERYGIELPIDLPFIAPTVREAAAYVEEALAAGAVS